MWLWAMIYDECLAGGVVFGLCIGVLWGLHVWDLVLVYHSIVVSLLGYGEMG